VFDIFKVKKAATCSGRGRFVMRERVSRDVIRVLRNITGRLVFLRKGTVGENRHILSEEFARLFIF